MSVSEQELFGLMAVAQEQQKAAVVAAAPATVAAAVTKPKSLI